VKPTTATKRINEPPSEVPNVVQSRWYKSGTMLFNLNIPKFPMMIKDFSKIMSFVLYEW
jgi:hypothetical protein